MPPTERNIDMQKTCKLSFMRENKLKEKEKKKE